MNKSYSIEIPNERQPTYRIVLLIVSIINLLAFIYLALNTGSENLLPVIYAGVALSATALGTILLKRFGKYLPDSWAAAALIMSAILWVLSGNYLPGFLLLIFAALGIVAQRKPVIHFESSYIRYPSFPEKRLHWADVDFVMLKDDILTIEMKSNHLLQFTLDKVLASNTDANQFNEFCASCVSNAASNSPT